MRTVILGVAFLAAVTCAVRADTDHAALARNAVENVIRPAYDGFAAATATLNEKTGALCEHPSTLALQDTREAFKATVMRWSVAEIFQFGPVNRHHRYERLFFWPDRKGLGQRQVQSALTENDETVTRAAALAGKSVALQGMPALEYLLYGDGADSLARSDGEGAFRCRFAAAIAANMAEIAQELAGAWAADAPFTRAFLDPGADDPLYRSHEDVTLELYKAFSGGIERVRDQKIGRVLGNSVERARPRLAAFWRSGLTFPNLAGNLEAVRALFADGGFADIVAAQSPGVEDSVLFDLGRTASSLAGEQATIAESVKDPDQRAKLEALRVGLKSARDTATELIAEGAGLSFGFNATDGD